MSKNKNGQFQNLAAKKFAAIEKVELYSEDEIYRILSTDLLTILKQISEAKKTGKYPDYAVNMFANVSAAKYLYEYVELWEKQIRKKGDSKLMTMADVRAARKLVSDAYTKRDKFRDQYQDEKLRNELLLNTYAKLDPDGVKHAKKLKLGSKKLEKELALRISIPPVYSIDRVCRIFDMSAVSTKKKKKILKKLARTKERFVEIIGAALTIDKPVTDFVEMAYRIVIPEKEEGKKLNKKRYKRRIVLLRAYATAFKKRKRFNIRLTDGFYKANKKIIKKLIAEDLGFKKAFTCLTKTAEASKTKIRSTIDWSAVGGDKDKKDKKHDKKARPEKARDRDRAPVSSNQSLTAFLDELKPSGATN